MPTYSNIESTTLLELEEALKQIENSLYATMIKYAMAVASVILSILFITIALIGYFGFRWIVLISSFVYLALSLIFSVRLAKTYKQLNAINKDMHRRYLAEVSQTERIKFTTDDGLYFYRD